MATAGRRRCDRAWIRVGALFASQGLLPEDRSTGGDTRPAAYGELLDTARWPGIGPCRQRLDEARLLLVAIRHRASRTVYERPGGSPRAPRKASSTVGASTASRSEGPLTPEQGSGSTADQRLHSGLRDW